MIKKAVILAAGKGKRMGEITEFLPKPLLEINNRPFLYYMLKNLKKLGFDEIAVIVHYKKEKIEHFLKEHGIKATLIEQGEPLGTGHAVKAAKDFVNNENFLVLMGDDYYSDENINFVNKEDGFCYILGYKHEHPERFGVLIEEDCFLKKIVEKPQKFESDLVNPGLYKFTPEIFEALDKIKKSERGEYEITDAITLLAEKRKVKIVKVDKGWLCLNRPEDIQVMEEFLKKHKDIV